MIHANPHIKFFDGDRRGYVRCELDRGSGAPTCGWSPTVATPDAPVYTFASFVVDDGEPGARRV